MTDTPSISRSMRDALSIAQNQVEGNAADFTLPDDYAMLVALRAAIDTKIAAMQTTGVAALREKYAQEAAALGVTPEDVLGIASKKPRGRKAKSKQRDE